MKTFFFLLTFLSTIGINLLSQITFIGFDQKQCNLLENSPYTYRSFYFGKWTTPGYEILKDGIVVYSPAKIDNDPHWIKDLKFINDSTGFLIEATCCSGGIYKTIDFGKTWKVIGYGALGYIGNCFIDNGYLGMYIINSNEAFLITSYACDTTLVVSRASEFSKNIKRIRLDTLNTLKISLTDSIFGNPFCIKDTLSFKILLSTDTIKIEITLQQLPLPPVEINSIVSTNRLDIYPNPTSDYIKIHYTEEIRSPIIISIQDILGKKIISKKLNNSVNEEVYIGNLPEGIYLVNISIENRIFQSKFIKINNR
jgi:Secretion system C-terminal sorting domain